MGYQVSWTYQLVWGYFGLSFEVYCLLVFDSIGFKECLKKENVWFSKELLSKNLKNPCSCFSYRLTSNHPKEVIPIGKEP